MMWSNKGGNLKKKYGKNAVEPRLLKIWSRLIYEKWSWDIELFDWRTFRFVRTHPEELHPPNKTVYFCVFWQILGKMSYVDKYAELSTTNSGLKSF